MKAPVYVADAPFIEDFSLAVMASRAAQKGHGVKEVLEAIDLFRAAAESGDKDARWSASAALAASLLRLAIEGDETIN